MVREKAAAEGGEHVAGAVSHDRERGILYRITAMREVERKKGDDEAPELVDEGAQEKKPRGPRQGAEAGTERRGEGRGHKRKTPLASRQAGSNFEKEGKMIFACRSGVETAEAAHGPMIAITQQAGTRSERRGQLKSGWAEFHDLDR